MSWRITETKPLAGVSRDGDDRLLIDLEEAFDSPPTFEQVARHVGLSPEELFNDLLEETDDIPLVATRIIAMRVILHALDPDEFAENRKYFEDPDAVRDSLSMYAERARREEIYAYEDVHPNEQTTRFPLWLVPTSSEGKSLVIPAPLSGATNNLINLREFHWESIHGYLEANHDDFVELREECEKIYIASRRFITETRLLEKEAAPVFPPMNDLALMLGNMLGKTDPPLDHHPHAEAAKKNRRVAAEVAADLLLGASLATEHFFGSEDHPVAKRRGKQFRIIKSSLENFPGQAASNLVMLDDLAPPEVAFEYFRAMEACVTALSMAAPEYAGPLLEKHFMHAVVSVAEAVKPIDTSGLGGVRKTLCDAVNSFDIGKLKTLDTKGAFPALVVGLGPPRLDIEAVMKWAGKPAKIVKTLSNYALAAVEGATFAPGSGSALATRLALGLVGEEWLEIDLVWEAVLAEAAGERFDKDKALADALRNAARAKIKKATKSTQRRILASNKTILLGASSIQFFLDFAGMMVMLGESRDGGGRWRSEDWLKFAQQVHSVASSAATLIERLGMRYSEAAVHATGLQKKAVRGAVEWSKMADSKVLPAIEIVLGYWAAREKQLESIRWGKKSDTAFELVALVVGLVKYVHPVAGLVATAVMFVVRELKELEGGANGMHKYYEHKRAEIVAQLMGIEGMDEVAERWMERFAADNPGNLPEVAYENWHKALDVRNVKDTSLTRLDRLFALVYQLNEWRGAMKPVSVPAFALSPGKRSQVMQSLKGQGYSQQEIELVLKV